MKKLFFGLFLIHLMISCGNASLNKRPSTDSLEINPDALSYGKYLKLLDTVIKKYPGPKEIFLKFSLGGTRRDAEKRINQLIKEGKIKDLSSLRFEVINTEIEGYPYDIFPSGGSQIKTLLIPEYSLGVLTRVILFPIGGNEEASKLKSFIKHTYGQYDVEIKDFNSSFSSDISTIWFKDGYEISYSTRPLSGIEFTDPVTRNQRKEFKKVVDSMAVKETNEDFKQ